MTSLVTGAGGFIGSHVVEQLLADRVEVRALLRRADRAAEWRQRGINVVVGDIRDPDLVQTAARDVDVIYHCAAATGDRCTREAIYATGLTGLQNELEALRQQGAGRLVLLSGLSVLGLRNYAGPSEELPLRRSGDPEIDVKVDAEQLALDYARRHGVAVTILRTGFIYGPGDRRNLPKLVDAVRGGKLVYIGTRHNVLPLVHISDMVQALLLAGRSTGAGGRIYHITDGSRTTIGELASFLAGCLGCRPPGFVLPYFLPYVGCVGFELLSRLWGGPVPAPISRSELLFLGTSRFVDVSRARSELGYVPRVGYRDGLPPALQWINEQSYVNANVAVSGA
jgi:nucleoside-diphosphate-sugar epimerase